MNRIDIDQLTEAEHIDLNHRIVERLHFLQHMHEHRAMLGFSIDDRVAFDPPGRPATHGMLIKYNRKTVTILTDDGRRWNVPPAFIRRAEPRDITPRDGKLLRIEPGTDR